MKDIVVWDELMQLVGDQLNRDLDAAIWTNEPFLSWLAEDYVAGMSASERAAEDALAADFARRLSRKIRARNLAERLPQQDLRRRPADVQAQLRKAEPFFTSARCAPLVDLPVAAGEGREIWDEECDTWIELPRELPSSRYIALRVAGDSMLPLLEPRDVILVQLDTMPDSGDLVVARRPDEGYVVKCAGRVLSRELELDSLNPQYESVRIPRDRQHILGTVVARFRDN